MQTGQPGSARSPAELETVWENGTLIVRAPASAYRRRGVIAVTLAPLVMGLLIPLLLSVGDPEEPIVLLLVGVCALTLLGSLLAGIFLLSFAGAWSARSTWAFRRVQAPDGSVDVLLSRPRGGLPRRLAPGSYVTAVGGMAGVYRLVLNDAGGDRLNLANQLNERYRAELDRAILEINGVLGATPTPALDPGSAALPGSESGGTITPGERSLAMLCYLPVQGVFLLASIGCLVASRSRYARSAAKQSLLQFALSILVLGGILGLFGVPTALLDGSPAQPVFAAVLGLALFGHLGWNLGAHVYACIRFYQGRPWVMPWLRPLARRWFEA